MMKTIAYLSIPLWAAASAYLWTLSPWWLGGVVLGVLYGAVAVLAGSAPVWTWVSVAILVAGVGWVAALIGHVLYADEETVAGVVWVALSLIMLALWFFVPEGTF